MTTVSRRIQSTWRPGPGFFTRCAAKCQGAPTEARTDGRGGGPCRGKDRLLVDLGRTTTAQNDARVDQDGIGARTVAPQHAAPFSAPAGVREFLTTWESYLGNARQNDSRSARKRRLIITNELPGLLAYNLWHAILNTLSMHARVG